ncbi:MULTISPECIES: L-threonylcarbamoyladenylate synthase [unclassified Paenibacillus]|uniref:L-threonylcarbamoyladenylate synthase n=1 Tax=unclassified Paenibacillus TaxID=185978 RepID=UPI001AE97C8E|nr:MULTISPECIES: L-threonylcarbamoyladenylate synthase [unclassified Paenibacillus]MBP1153219.1 L-threonylcarbamoyladenylate synthase [Paenibacillus sp. PvP091]MBP1171398.1 L-threonylcarbamoyladenylate synthase [Paenibacillus sp. PvR098]MBP2442426.1 L-threonylcarbamoyladenylate synthase [Paenibacillus sp. PvP052]
MTKETKVWEVDGQRPEPEKLREAAKLLQQGRTVAFPTETVYGLGADARSSEAVADIFSAKGRPSDNPLIVHIADRSQLEELALPPEEAVSRLLDAFWPGPLTVVLPVRPGVLSPLVTAGLSTVGLRMPDHPVALQLIAASGCPIAAPSANRSGRPSPTQASHVLEDLTDRIAGIVDGGETGVGVESTVVEYTGGAVHILRPGGITAEQLRQALPPHIPVLEASSEHQEPAAPRAPGMKYAHYAPRGTLLLVQGRQGTAPEQIVARMQRELDEARARGERTGVLTYGEHAGAFHADCVVTCGRLDNLEAVAHRLYAALREFDEAGVSFIAAEACPEEGIGVAIMNRLRKAAGGRIVTL